MKGVIVEIRNDYVAVLSDNGSIIKVKNNNYQIGEEIQMKNTIKKSKKKIFALAASVACATLIVGTGVYAYATPYSYVSLDVNPSIEYEVNRFDRVIDVTAVNDDGAEIINKLDLENKTIGEAIHDTITEINEQGYFPEGETGGVVISTSNDKDADKAEELANDLEGTVKDVIAGDDITAEVEVHSVGRERVLAARELGVTPGKLNLVEKLQKSAINPEDVSIEEWLNKPVKEIMKETKANKKQEKIKTENEETKIVQNEDTNVIESKDTNTIAIENENKDTNASEKVKSDENKGNSSKEVKQSNPSAEKSKKNK